MHKTMLLKLAHLNGIMIMLLVTCGFPTMTCQNMKKVYCEYWLADMANWKWAIVNVVARDYTCSLLAMTSQNVTVKKIYCLCQGKSCSGNQSGKFKWILKSLKLLLLIFLCQQCLMTTCNVKHDTCNDEAIDNFKLSLQFSQIYKVSASFISLF